MIVLDSSFVVAFHNARDVHHAPAVDVMGRLLANEWGAILLPEYVFLEVTTVLAARRNLETAVAVGETLLGAREVELIPCSELFLDAFETFRNQDRGDLSFTDATIVALCRRRGVGHVATFDEDFVGIAGIDVVPSA